jgi:ABC-2 type transport system permease protein
MMLTLILQTLKDKRKSLIIYSISNILLLWMFVAFFKSLQGQFEGINDLLKSYPETFLKAFNIENFNFSTIESFISAEQFSITWPIMVVLSYISFGASIIANEVEQGTMDILLSLPISRIKLFISRYIAGIVSLLLFTSISVFPIIPFARLYGIPYQTSHFITLFFICLLFGWTVLSISIFFSSLFSEKGKVFSIAGGILIVMYILNVFAGLKENMKNLHYFSFFYYFNQNEILAYNKFNYASLAVFATISIICTIAGLLIFNKRDITAT